MSPRIHRAGAASAGTRPTRRPRFARPARTLGAVIVAGGVLAPARHGEVAPPAVAGPRGRQHRREAAVRQQVRRGRRLLGGGNRAATGGFTVANLMARELVRCPVRGPARRRVACVPAATIRLPGRSAPRGSASASSHRAGVGDGDDRHALMMRHVGTDDGDGSGPWASGTAYSPRPRRSHSGHARRPLPAGRGSRARRLGRPLRPAQSHKARRHDTHRVRASKPWRERRNSSTDR